MRLLPRTAVVALTAVLALTGCATPIPTSPKQTVFALEGEYAAALAVGAAYNELPRCPSTRDGLCSDPVKIEQLRAAVKTTDAALKLVELAVRGNGDAVSALITASAAVGGLRQLTLSLKVK